MSKNPEQEQIIPHPLAYNPSAVAPRAHGFRDNLTTDVTEMRLHLLALVFAMIPACALADDQGSQGLFYVAGGGGAGGPSFSAGAGTKVDVLEVNAIDLGKVSGGTARFVGMSLVQNTTPKSGFNALFRIGLGRETTTFPGGVSAHRMWFSNGVYFGLGAQYQASTHFAFRAEVNRILYAASPDGVVGGVRYPATLSALYIF